jgi:HlyD family secretion protein
LKKAIVWTVVVILIVAAVLVIRSLIRPSPAEVAVWAAKAVDISETVTGVATGYVEPARRVSLQPEIIARIKEVRTKRGDRVKAGQVLVVLDDTDFRDQMLALDASIPLFEARLRQATAREAQVRQDFERAKRLSEAGTLTVQQFETARMGFELAAAEFDAARSALGQARVNRDIAASALRKTLIKAPFDGLLLECDLVPGQLWVGAAAAASGTAAAASASRPSAAGVMSEAPALLAAGGAFAAPQGRVEIADDSRMFAVVDVDENEFGKLRLGQAAALTFDSLGGTKATGILAEIYPSVSRALDQNRTVRVRIGFDSSAVAEAVPGMSVNAEILISRRTVALAVPTSSVLIRPQGRIVFVVRDGRLKETAVTTGISNWDWTEVLSGLAAGDRVAAPPEKVRLEDGLRVIESGSEF